MDNFFKMISDNFSSFVDKLIDILPKSPIYFVNSIPEVKKVLGYLNWFFPIDAMLALTEAWLTAIVIYYIVQVILRWIKVVE